MGYVQLGKPVGPSDVPAIAHIRGQAATSRPQNGSRPYRTMPLSSVKSRVSPIVGHFVEEGPRTGMWAAV